MVEEERRSKAYAKILNQASTYQQVSHLPAGQTPTGRTDRYLPAGQIYTSRSDTYHQVSHLPAGQPPTSRTATY